MIGLDESVADKVRGLEQFEEIFGSGFSFAGSILSSMKLSPNGIAEVDLYVDTEIEDSEVQQYLVRFIMQNGMIEADYCSDRSIEEVFIEPCEDSDLITVAFDGVKITLRGTPLYITVEKIEDDEWAFSTDGNEEE